MIQQELDKANKAMLTEMTKATKVVLTQSLVKRNSNLMRSVKWEKKQSMWVLIANDYYQYLSEGRKRKARKVPVQDLITWIKQYGIQPRAGQTINQLAFAIQRSIFINGIRGKKYEDKIENVTLDIAAEGTAEALSEIITNELADTINKV